MKSIELLEGYYHESPLTIRQGLKLESIKELYRQQKQMYDNKTNSVESHIVGISQPQGWPIVRGKASANVEFGAKLANSVVNGFAYMEKLSWDNFNEGMTLKEAIERYKPCHGYYPESLHVDKIFRSRDNILYCLEQGIRISGLKLSWPLKKTEPGGQKQARRDALYRNCSEGKFGEGKRLYGLNLIRAKLQKTSETIIMINLIVVTGPLAQKSFRLFFKERFPCFQNKIFAAGKAIFTHHWARRGLVFLKKRLVQKTLSTS